MTSKNSQIAEPEKRTPSVLLFFSLSAIVAGATAFAHWPALEAQALSFDDHQYLVGNRLVTHPGWESVGTFLIEVLHPSTVGGYYQPLAMISLMIDDAMGGRPDNLRAFHRTSLALHVTNTVLLSLLFWRLFGSAWAACVVALLFGVHPLTVETIPWVGERKTLLATFFALASLICYVEFTRARLSGSGGRRLGPLVGCIGLFVLALMSKPTTTMLPLAMLLMDLWPLNRFSLRAVVEKIPLVAVAAVSAVITYLSQAASYIQTPTDVGALRIPLILCHNIVFYLWKTVYPANLSSHYPFPEPMGLSNPAIAVGVIGTVALLGVLLAAWKWSRAPLIGWSIFFVLILPTMGVVGFTIVIASDKYVYLPAVGLLMLLTAGLVQIEMRAYQRFSVIAIASAVCLFLAVLETRATREYLNQWRTTESLYAHMLSLAPNAATLHFGMGYCHETRGRLAEAEQSYRRAIELDAKHVHAHNNLGLLLIDQEKYDQAEAQFRTVLQLTPQAADVLSNLALALAKQGRNPDAITASREALQINPTYAPALNNWGLALSLGNRLDEAIEKFREAVRIDSEFADARRNLAAALWRQGGLSDAEYEYAELLRRQPDDATSHINMGRLLMVQKKWTEAANEFQTALRIEPNNVDAAAALRDLQSNSGK